MEIEQFTSEPFFSGLSIVLKFPKLCQILDIPTPSKYLCKVFDLSWFAVHLGAWNVYKVWHSMAAAALAVDGSPRKSSFEIQRVCFLIVALCNTDFKALKIEIKLNLGSPNDQIKFTGQIGTVVP